VQLSFPNGTHVFETTVDGSSVFSTAKGDGAGRHEETGVSALKVAGLRCKRLVVFIFWTCFEEGTQGADSTSRPFSHFPSAIFFAEGLLSRFFNNVPRPLLLQVGWSGSEDLQENSRT
jgi:hypothetical protein